MADKTAAPVYTPSGRFGASSLAIPVLALVGTGLGMASFLAYLTSQSGYPVLWIWIPITGSLCVLVRRIVQQTKCRNRAIGFGLGGLIGIVVLVGMYHIDQCSRWGVGWARLDRLPGFVVFRMETDGWWARDRRMPLGLPLPHQAGIDPWLPAPRGWNWHWGAFLAELAFFVIAPVCAGWARASRPFSERLNDWCACDSILLTPNSAAALRRALSEGAILKWVETEVQKTYRLESHICVTVWYCPRPSLGEPGESEVYLAVGNSRPRLIDPETAAALTWVFPGLEAIVAPDSVKYETIPLAVDALIPLAGHSRLIRILGPHACLAKERRVFWKGKAIAYSIDFLPVLVLAGFVAGMGLLTWAEEEGVMPKGSVEVWGVAVCVPGMFALLLYAVRRNKPGFKALVRFYRRLITEEAAQRADQLFALDDPHVMYGEFLPRRVWGDLSARRLECDSGLLLLDQERALLLFEGDRDRYVVPMSSILRCEVEEVTQSGTTEGLYCVVLLLQLASGTYELPIVVLDGLNGVNYWEKAEILRGMIWKMMGVGGVCSEDMANPK